MFGDMIWLVRLVMGEERVAISLFNDELMRNWLGVDHWPVIYDIYIYIFMYYVIIWYQWWYYNNDIYIHIYIYTHTYHFFEMKFFFGKQINQHQLHKSWNTSSNMRDWFWAHGTMIFNGFFGRKWSKKSCVSSERCRDCQESCLKANTPPRCFGMGIYTLED